MSKTCTADSCTRPVWGKGYCDWHQRLRTDKKPKVLKPRKPIKKVGVKLAKEKLIYAKLRIEFLEKPENMFCAVYPHLRTDQIHHTRGRGKNLNKVKTWLAVSDDGHKWIEEHPLLAKERGFSESRLSLVTPLNKIE